MIISLTIENWMSFRDRTMFSMGASLERQHSERLARVNKFGLRVLPVASLYGGNASGKTNFCKALAFAQRFVVAGVKPDERIPRIPYRLAKGCADKPTSFVFELLINELIYEFSFSVTSSEVREEKLVVINSSRETTLYHRVDGKPHFDASLKDLQRLQYVFEGTRTNVLFLTNAIDQNVDTFRPVYNWFRHQLVLIAPDARFRSADIYDMHGVLLPQINRVLSQLDTGIKRLEPIEVSLDEAISSDDLREDLERGVTEEKVAHVQTDQYERMLVSRKNGRMVTQRLVTVRAQSDGDEIQFELRDESDGSRRIIDLLPAFIDLWSKDSQRVYIIDEIGRSLHPLLIRRLMEVYLDACDADHRTQLILTTHDVSLMDQRLFRRDEMWAAERDHDGATTLISFGDFEDMRHDKDIRKSYLYGRLGGTPTLWFDGNSVGAGDAGE